MSYDSAVSALYELGHELAHTPSHKFDLAHMRVFLDAMGNPQNKFRSVLIAGTNGKGSTAATLASIVQCAGHKSGLYTSPHLMRINERVRVDGALISDERFARVYERVEEVAQKLVTDGKLPWHPSFFEMLTAMAFVYFADSAVEVAVLEVGMGGRLDATNVVEPLVAVITDIDLDHQKFLGNTIAEIAEEKAGIVHPGGLLVTLPQHPHANEVLGRAVLERNARAVSAAQYVPSTAPGSEGNAYNKYSLTVMGQEIKVESPLIGRHQIRNLALAIATAEQLNEAGVTVTPEAIERGIRETKWPGRFQVIPASGDRPEILLDVAHNPAGAWALRAALSEVYEGRHITLLFAVLRDKNIEEITQILFPLADHVIACPVNNPRSATPDQIEEAAYRSGVAVQKAHTFDEALAQAVKATPNDGVLVITGSIYLVGEALEKFKSRQ